MSTQEPTTERRDQEPDRHRSIIGAMSDGEIRDDTATMPGLNGGTLRRGGSPGRPKGPGYADVQTYIRSHLFADQAQDRIGIIDVLMQQARRGNIRAIELSLWYGIGKPTETIDLTVKVREAATRLAQEMGIDDAKVQSEVDALVGR